MLCMLFIAGCDKPAASTTAAVTVDSVNYMHERAVEYTLYDLSQTPPKAIGGSFVDSLGSGGEKGCCIALPKIWRPQMKVRVDWKESDQKQTYEKQTRELEIPKYDSPADLYVVFYPSPERDVEVVVSAAEPGHPEWRGRIKKTPWDHCVETNGRKPCFLALPKMFDTVSSQGSCTYMREEHFPDAENLCSFALSECMRDFEDEAFCKGIVMGPRRK